MAAHIEGALYYERMGRDGPVMAFVHACQIEQPWMFNRYMIEFLKKCGLFPGK